jgi:hypothetical protein
MPAHKDDSVQRTDRANGTREMTRSVTLSAQHAELREQPEQLVRLEFVGDLADRRAHPPCLLPTHASSRGNSQTRILAAAMSNGHPQRGLLGRRPQHRVCARLVPGGARHAVTVRRSRRAAAGRTLPSSISITGTAPPGQLVIVIHGFPTNVDDAFTPSAGGQRIASASGSNGNGRHGSPPSPLIEEAQAINDATGHTPRERLGVSLGDP